MPRKQQPEAFWEKVDRSGGPAACWPWKLSRNWKGYGMVKCGRWMMGAHVRAHELGVGPVPDGKQVLHSCPGGDNPACCNPAHLRAGTHLENMADRSARGRTARGVRSGAARHPEAMKRTGRRGAACHFAKLDDAGVERIRSEGPKGGKAWKAVLAAELGISVSLIYRILSGDVRASAA